MNLHYNTRGAAFCKPEGVAMVCNYTMITHCLPDINTLSPEAFTVRHAYQANPSYPWYNYNIYKKHFACDEEKECYIFH